MVKSSKQALVPTNTRPIFQNLMCYLLDLTAHQDQTATILQEARMCMMTSFKPHYQLSMNFTELVTALDNPPLGWYLVIQEASGDSAMHLHQILVSVKF